MRSGTRCPGTPAGTSLACHGMQNHTGTTHVLDSGTLAELQHLHLDVPADCIITTHRAMVNE